jgi:hypothetical protein
LLVGHSFSDWCTDVLTNPEETHTMATRNLTWNLSDTFVLFKSHCFTLSTKLRSYNKLLIPVLKYGSKSWVLTKSNGGSSRVSARKVFWRIFDPMCENGLCHVRYNNELYELFSEPDIVKTITIGRLLWPSHIIWMLDDNSIKKAQIGVEIWKTKSEMDGQNTGRY